VPHQLWDSPGATNPDNEKLLTLGGAVGETVGLSKELWEIKRPEKGVLNEGKVSL